MNFNKKKYGIILLLVLSYLSYLVFELAITKFNKQNLSYQLIYLTIYLNNHEILQHLKLDKQNLSNFRCYNMSWLFCGYIRPGGIDLCFPNLYPRGALHVKGLTRLGATSRVVWKCSSDRVCGAIPHHGSSRLDRVRVSPCQGPATCVRTDMAPIHSSSNIKMWPFRSCPCPGCKSGPFMTNKSLSKHLRQYIFQSMLPLPVEQNNCR